MTSYVWGSKEKMFTTEKNVTVSVFMAETTVTMVTAVTEDWFASMRM